MGGLRTRKKVVRETPPFGRPDDRAKAGGSEPQERNEPASRRRVRQPRPGIGLRISLAVLGGEPGEKKIQINLTNLTPRRMTRMINDLEATGDLR